MGGKKVHCTRFEVKCVCTQVCEYIKRRSGRKGGKGGKMGEKRGKEGLLKKKRKEAQG